jgi:hypothetical protein
MDSVSVEATLGRAIGLTSPRLSQFPRTRITASPRLLPRLAVWRAVIVHHEGQVSSNQTTERFLLTRKEVVALSEAVIQGMAVGLRTSRLPRR